MASEKLRIAAVGDIHVHATESELCRDLFHNMSSDADVIVLCGDLTNRGIPEEAQILATELHSVKVPVLGILGNHDYECDQMDEVEKILSDAGMHMLHREPLELEGVGFAGAKGFCGGFDKHMLAPWGEPMIKEFVREAIDEALLLENGLTRLRTERKVAVLHYAPISATVEGEPLEIWPFLGSSRLSDPICRFGVSACFHGHAHRGVQKGEAGNVPVYNVSLPLMRTINPERPYLVLEV